jgi:CBS domain-containing protein
MIETMQMTAPRLTLNAPTAAALMHNNPISIRATETIAEALELFITKGISAVPVIDETGKPVGVLSRSDILVQQAADTCHAAGAKPHRPSQEPDETPARAQDVMTPTVFSVLPETPIEKVVADMLTLGVHRLFVVDSQGVLIGVISACDVLRGLQ